MTGSRGGALIVALASCALSGCGLLLDAWPPDPVVEDGDAAPNGCVGGCRDTGSGELDASSGRDAGVVGGDADRTDLDAGFESTDGDVSVDDARVDAASDAGSSSPTDGGPTDVGPPDAAAIDAGSPDVCIGAHPIVGPPRTCEAGSCLCTFVDACFTSDVVRACCADDFSCAPPLPECMGTHPIIGGATRTCERGSCYCGNPDACFPADRASRCCAVDVVCAL